MKALFFQISLALIGTTSFLFFFTKRYSEKQEIASNYLYFNERLFATRFLPAQE
jgi:hypothetical protein